MELGKVLREIDVRPEPALAPLPAVEPVPEREKLPLEPVPAEREPVLVPA